MNNNTFNESNSENCLKNINVFFSQNGVKLEKLVIMTIGNVLLSDDGVGPMIYKELAYSLRSESVLLINAELNPENYLKKIIEFVPSHIIIIDAIESNLKPGTVLFFKKDEIEDELFLHSSTHMISILHLNEYLIERLPKVKILNLGIQVKNTDFGFQLIDSDVYECAIKLKDYLIRLLMQQFKNAKSN